MAFRWKTQQIGQSQAEMAAQQMAGYNPQQQMGVPFQTAPGGMQPPPDMTGYGESLQAASDRAGVLQQIEEKEARLAELDARIADIDRQYPELKNGGQEWEIAAKRAEIGDMSAYDSMMARGQQAGGNARSIESEIQKAYIDMSFAGPEQRPAFQNRINALEKEYKDVTGQDYVFNGSDVKRGLTQGGDTSVTLADVKSKLSTMKDNKGQITQAQYDEIMGDLGSMPFSEDLVNLYNELKNTTIAEKAAANRKVATRRANAALDEVEKNISYSALASGNGSYSKKASNGKMVTVTRAANGDIILECGGVKRPVKGVE